MPYKDRDRQRAFKAQWARNKRRQERLHAAAARAAASSTPARPGGPGSPGAGSGTGDDGLPSLEAVAQAAWDELQSILAHEPADLSRARVTARLCEVASSLVERAALERRVQDLEAVLGDDGPNLRAIR